MNLYLFRNRQYIRNLSAIQILTAEMEPKFTYICGQMTDGEEILLIET